MRILLTRARADAERTAARLEALGHSALISPVIEIVATGARLPAASFDAIIATSSHPFTCAGLQLLTGLPLYAVGERTREAAQRVGWTAPIDISDDAKALIARLRADSVAFKRVLYLAGRDRKPDIEAAAQKIGVDLEIIETYVAREVSSLGDEAERALRERELDAALHYSRRSAELFIALVQRAELWGQATKLRHFALSPDVAEPLAGAGARTDAAARPHEDRLLALLA
jgi:uroporphyrinogen-III synthase